MSSQAPFVGRDDFIAFGRQQGLQYHKIVFFIIYNQDRFHEIHSAKPSIRLIV